MASSILSRTEVLLLVLALAPPAFARDPKEVQARAQFEQAQKDYDLGRFKEALDEYSKAYEIKPLPGFLFNIAQCHRQLHNWDRATFFYRRYLDLSSGHVSNEQLVKDLIAECDAKQAEVERKKADEAAEAHRVELAKAEAEKAEAQKAAAEARAKQEEDAKAAALAAATLPQGAVPSPNTVVEPAPTESPPLYKKWWFWTGVGVVAAGAIGTAAYFQLTPTPTTLPNINARTTP